MKDETRIELNQLVERAEGRDVRVGLIRKRIEQDPPESEARSMILRLCRILWQSGEKA